MFEKKRGTRFLASVMALVMLLSLAPVGTLAAENEDPQENTAVTLPANEANPKPVVTDEENTENTNEEPTPPPRNECDAGTTVDNNDASTAISETPVISDPVQDLTGEEVLLTTQKSNGTVTIKLEKSYQWDNNEVVDVIIHDTTYTSTVQKDWNSCVVCVNVAQEVVDAQSSFATVVKKQGNKRAVANLTWENGSASGEIKNLKTGKGTKTLSLYYIYTNELPNKSTLDYTGSAAEYGPSGNDVPFIKVNVDIDKLLAHYGKVGLDHITPVTCEAVAKDADSEAKKRATENWWKWIVENCMDETAQTALKQTGIGNYYACYFINLNIDHGDGILTKEPPVYMVEMNYTEDNGQKQFLTGLVRGSDNLPAVSDVQSAFAEAIGATGDIDWTNKIFKKNGTYYSFSVTTDPAENADLSDPIAYKQKFDSYFVTTYSVVSQRMTIKHNPATINVTKTDKDTQSPLPGVEFQLYSNRACTEQNGVTTKETVTTNENGVASFTVTEPGQYYLKEITPLEGYKKLSGPVSIEVTVDENSFSHSGNNGTYNLSVDPVTVKNEKCDHSNIPENSWVDVKPAECGVKGSKEAICPDCGVKVTREIPALDHVWGAWTETKAPTKDSTGEAERICTLNSSHVDKKTLGKLGNDEYTYEVIKEAECQVAGTAKYTHTETGLSYEVTLPALDHVWGAWTETKAPTKDSTGEAERICTLNSSHVDKKTLGKLGNDEYTYEVIKEAECQVAGTAKYTHTETGLSYEVTLPALDHVWGAWTETKAPTKDSTGEAKRTCTLNPAHVQTKVLPKLPEETFTYTINRHLMNKDGDEVKLSAADKVVESGSKNENTVLRTLITGEMTQKQTNAGKNYVYVSSKTTYTVGEDTKETKPLTADSKLTKNTTIDLYFYLDKIGGKDENGKPIDGGDGTADCYQVTINYVSSNESWGTVSPLSKEVITLKNGEKLMEEATITTTASTATSAGGKCYFVNWTKKQEGTTDVSTVTSSANLPAQTIKNAKGGDVYTFTANFDRSSGGGSGGSNRPKPPVVEIPDDVPTGLNGKDHYAYIIGYGNNDVRPQNNITRAEVATIFFRLLTDETREANMTKSNGYNDVKDGDWFCCAVSTLSKMGIIKGYEDGSFKPNDPISRAEFAAIAARFDPDGDKTPASFSDVTSHWAKDEISIAANHGWIKGYEDGSFKPDQKITRAETMTLVNRVLNRLPETKDDLHKDMKTWVDNMDETAWYYLDVQEATNSHYFKNKTSTKFEQWTELRDTRDWSELEK